MKKTIPLFILLSGFLIHPALSQVDSVVNKYAIRDTQNLKVTLFDSDDPLQITLRFDISAYKKNKSDVEYLNAILTYHTSETDSINKNIKVRARGEIRRTGICDFPPLLLNFKMKDSIGGEFTGINKLKIVPYCKVGYEDYVLREYLVYKLYNLLTDNSFRVRLFKINYINTAKKGKPISQYGFALEPISLLEKRTHSKQVKSQNLTQRNIKPDMMDRFAIFNYMIGNTDWSVPIRHNALVLSQGGSDNAELGIIIPFDFDYAGLVNTEYATPFETLPIKTVRERLYLALCRSEDEFTNALKEFADKKDQFYKLINDFPYLSARSKKDIINFLGGFFRDFDKRNSIVYKLQNDCRWFEEQANLRVR
jgi:hypothetical protein